MSCPLRDPAANQLMDYKNNMRKLPGTIRTGLGNPVGIKNALLTVGTRGPALMDYQMFDEIGHFDRERIPERVVNAKGAGAFGYFEVTGDITKYCGAKMFEKCKKRTAVAVRFSNHHGENGSADTVRDIRGFAIKFYTDDGIWDLVCSNTPVYYIRDPLLFPSLVHSQRRNPSTHLRDANMFWDFLSLRPEALHQVCFLFSDRGIPDGYRHMNGYSGHAYKMINTKGEACYVKFHFKSDQGIKNLDPERAQQIASSDPDYGIRDLYNAIMNGFTPSWTLYIQIMTVEAASTWRYNPFDVTKVWPKADFPPKKVGKLVLNRNPNNYFSEVEQLAFNPANMIPGIEPSPDKMLMARLFAYADSQRHRLGANHLQIPVNCPYKVGVKNYQRDGPMAVTNNQGCAPNYFPNSFSGPVESGPSKALQSCSQASGEIYRYSSGTTQDNTTQATEFWLNVLDEEARARFIQNVSDSLIRAHPLLQIRVIRWFWSIHEDCSRMLIEAMKIQYAPAETELLPVVPVPL